MANEQIAFIEFHEPSLKDGEYSITVDQQVNVDASPKNFQISKKFYVGGPRFSIKPQDIHSSFPPQHNTGDHSNVLPHIILNRSTLPWERFADKNDPDLPWLWLFVYNDNDLTAGNVKKPQTNAANEIVNFLDPNSTKPPQSKAGFINLFEEPQEDLAEKVNVVSAKQSWLNSQKIVPSERALKLLTCVRKNIEADVESVEWTICVANRLPAPGVTSYAHLVSMEDRFANGSFDFNAGLDGGYVPLVSLASWSFSCPDDDCYKYSDRTIAKLTKSGISSSIIANIQKLEKGKLYRNTALFQQLLLGTIDSDNLTEFKQNESVILKCLQVRTETFHGLLEELDRGDLKVPDLPPVSDNQVPIDTANLYIAHGSVAMPHYQRNGNKTLSWYRGPLISGQDHTTINEDLLPIISSDELLRMENKLGMLDVSYAAAWELGRQLTLSNKDISMRQYAWKRQHAWGLKQAELDLFHDHLPYDRSQQQQQADANHWEKLMSWFENLNLLYHIPFNYLVPDEQMLPLESIRFFTLDNFWIDCLLDGAFSIGRVTSADYARDSSLSDKVSSAKHPVVSGFLLRSDVVAGWPALEINASSSLLTGVDKRPENVDPLNFLRREKLAPNLMICLFDGLVQTVDFHLKPEALHFGFERPDEVHDYYYKFLKNLTDGSKIDTTVPTGGSTVVAQNTGVVDVEALSSDIALGLSMQSKDMTSAQFALEMIEGVPRIRFNQG